jgi:hypothetical protein
MIPLRLGIRVFLALLRALAVVAAGTGLLYLIVPVVPSAGPRIADALPLDELAGRAGAPLWLFAVVWAVVAWAAGALISGRKKPIWLTALTLWFCAVAVDTISLDIVRQVQLTAALPAAVSTPAPYLIVVFFAVGSAWWNAAVPQRRRS